MAQLLRYSPTEKGDEMRYGMPVFGSRIAPRCTIADGMVTVTMNGRRVTDHKRIPLDGNSWMQILSVISTHQIDIFVCGGITRTEKSFLSGLRVSVVENVAGTADEIIDAIETGRIVPATGVGDQSLPDNGERIDCLACRNRFCLRGQPCHFDVGAPDPDTDSSRRLILEATRDVAMEDDRTLCRLSELIYFALEMKYRRIGLAYCSDLEEPARILTRVLQRFFQVIPVCCKIGGKIEDESMDLLRPDGVSRNCTRVACNPIGQAKALERAATEMNVIVGLCVGADCVFAQASHVPVSTLFVKDKSLANNPIGALYSDYYLNEAARPPAPMSQKNG
jgi:uncharacterized metal-binding protein